MLAADRSELVLQDISVYLQGCQKASVTSQLLHLFDAVQEV